MNTIATRKHPCFHYVTRWTVCVPPRKGCVENTMFWSRMGGQLKQLKESFLSHESAAGLGPKECV